MNSQRAQNKQKPSRAKDGPESAESSCAIKRLWKIKTYEMTFHHISVSFEKVSLVVPASRE